MYEGFWGVGSQGGSEGGGSGSEPVPPPPCGLRLEAENRLHDLFNRALEVGNRKKDYKNILLYKFGKLAGLKVFHYKFPFSRSHLV